MIRCDRDGCENPEGECVKEFFPNYEAACDQVPTNSPFQAFEFEEYEDPCSAWWVPQMGVEDLVALTEKAGAFHIEYNPQTAYYMSVEDTLKEEPCHHEFENAEEKQRAIDQNTMVRLQWYRRTAVGFSVWCAPDFGSLMRWLYRECFPDRFNKEPKPAPRPPRAPEPYIGKPPVTPNPKNPNNLPVCTTCGNPKPSQMTWVACKGGNPDFCSKFCEGYTQEPLPQNYDPDLKFCDVCEDWRHFDGDLCSDHPHEDEPDDDEEEHSCVYCGD